MKRLFVGAAGLAVLIVSGVVSRANPAVALIGRGLVDGALLDKSGLAGEPICQVDDTSNCIDAGTFGGFGSALTYTGHDDVFLAVPDRGPFDGRTDQAYRDRFHFLHIAVDSAKPFPNITTTLLDTRLLRGKGNTALVGDSSAFDLSHSPGPRFDPEGVAIGRDGSFFVSDEYGPAILQFNRQGHLMRRLAVPEKFAIAQPSSQVDSAGGSFELYPGLNTSGRQANRGMEGLTITPDGQWLIGIMQNALIQDHGLVAMTPAPVFPQPVPGRLGVNNRLVKYNIETGDTYEYVYVLEGISQGRGVNEILAINDHEFLVLERDNRSLLPTPPNAAQTPNFKRIYRIDLNTPNLTDVSNITSLPASRAELDALKIVPVAKSLFLDLIDPSYTVGGTPVRDLIAEKIEGLAWGPDLPDGRHVLYVISDNDLYPGRPTQIYAFAIDPVAANLSYQPQQIAEPLFPPGQVRKLVR